MRLSAPPHDELPCHQNSWDCAWDYLMVPERFAQHASDARWTWEGLTEWVQGARDQLVEPIEPQPAEHELPGLLRDALDADWLWHRAGLFGGTPSLLSMGPMTPPHQHLDASRAHAWVDDDVVGGFQVIVLRPDGPGPHPALLLTHGHNGDSHQSVEELGGLELADAGFVVLAPTYRVNGGSVVEDAVTRLLLTQGFSLLALRVYEQLLALRLLRSMEDVDPARIGLVAHSGSTAAAMITARLSPWVAALVTDNECQYYSEGTDQRSPVPELLDETLPALHPLYPALLRLDELPQPALRIPYGPLQSLDRVRAFLDQTLKGR